MSRTIVILEGDQTGQELLEEALRVIHPSVTGFEVNYLRYDLSLENRLRTNNAVVHEAGRAIREFHVGLKAATITPPDQNGVGSPNAILREEIDAEVILRTGRRIPGIRPIGGVFAPISVVRMARGDAYGAEEWREGEPGSLSETAYRTEVINRQLCRDVALFAFQQALKNGAKVFGGPKFTVSPVYEGMLKEEMDKAALRYPSVRYDPQLIDATFALLLATTGEALVIPSLNRDGDLLSDMVLQMFGSIAGAESMVISVNDDGEVDCVMAEAPHGTAPTLEGRNIANPMAMIMAAAGLLSFMKEDLAKRVSRAIYEATLEAVYDGIRTSDLGGSAQTTEFTDEVIRRVRAKLDVWAALL
ncbi:MAG: isocitrate/isopropylmalate family dehydrogenase [Anaerolineae bacterium]|nr:isocitrate/isopropylmalate family dehydrogenase [Anaerolineae bacterium]MCO5187834.1 isocitrate/isopropylmalate family dehydrogenase [Anaerolineae bacterium]MCO5195432.1 isocitrate/isopropylmalate family dehydrogenase [Anaerolineae bacterium]MCO5203561.1 isocitrate/isopropylmalate family dehydrogenase [Anaerolineae bacterium]